LNNSIFPQTYFRSIRFTQLFLT